MQPARAFIVSLQGPRAGGSTSEQFPALALPAALFQGPLRPPTVYSHEQVIGEEPRCEHSGDPGGEECPAQVEKWVDVGTPAAPP